jgi:hypothetical protein
VHFPPCAKDVGSKEEAKDNHGETQRQPRPRSILSRDADQMNTIAKGSSFVQGVITLWPQIGWLQRGIHDAWRFKTSLHHAMHADKTMEKDRQDLHHSELTRDILGSFNNMYS